MIIVIASAVIHRRTKREILPKQVGLLAKGSYIKALTPQRRITSKKQLTTTAQLSTAIKQLEPPFLP